MLVLPFSSHVNSSDLFLHSVQQNDFTAKNAVRDAVVNNPVKLYASWGWEKHTVLHITLLKVIVKVSPLAKLKAAGYHFLPPENKEQTLIHWLRSTLARYLIHQSPNPCLLEQRTNEHYLQTFLARAVTPTHSILALPTP